MDTELKCGNCLLTVCKDVALTHEAQGWTIASDARRHWVKDNKAVCGAPVKVLGPRL